MEIDFGFQPGHSEDMVLIADFRTIEEAEKAMTELARFIMDIHATIEAEREMSESKTIGEAGAKEYLEEAKKRWLKLCGENELHNGIDWSADEAYIGTRDNHLKFMVNTAGSGMDEIAHFLIKQGATNVSDGDGISTDLVPYIIDKFKQENGLDKIIEKGIKAVENKHAKKTRSK